MAEAGVSLKTIAHSKPLITGTDQASLLALLESGMIACGENRASFEAAVKQRLAMPHARSYSSGTQAIAAALRALGVGSHHEVILPTYVCHSVRDAITSVGAKPVYCDVDCTGCISRDTVFPHLSNRTGAVIAVHIFGHLCDIDLLSDIGLPIIEDACQAFSFKRPGGVTGGWGKVSVLSFHATKCLTTAEGGMLLWQESALAGDATFTSYSPLSDLQAALGLSQLLQYGEMLKQRRAIKQHFDAAVETQSSLVKMEGNGGDLFRYMLLTENGFEKTQAKFLAQGIQAKRGVDQLLHRVEKLPDRNFPNAIEIFERAISVPFYPALTAYEVQKICQSILSASD